MKRGMVRIIAGQWRGRRLAVPNVQGLRPTPDRVRETLFNWLAAKLPDAYCLDAFAGSGVLGFEALSRGAKHVVMVDQSQAVVIGLKQEASKFGVDNIDIYCASIPKQLKPPVHRFNIVFLDPPYGEDLLLPTCRHLEENAYLADSAYIYLEANQVIKDNDLPLHWHIIKSQHAGQVFYHLVHRELIKNEQ